MRVWWVTGGGGHGMSLVGNGLRPVGYIMATII